MQSPVALTGFSGRQSPDLVTYGTAELPGQSRVKATAQLDSTVCMEHGVWGVGVLPFYRMTGMENERLFDSEKGYVEHCLNFRTNDVPRLKGPGSSP